MDEYAQVPVHGRHMGWAQSSLSQMGIPFSMGGKNGSVYIILIPTPYAPMAQAQPWAYSKPPRQFPIVQIAVAVLILVGAWFLFQAAPMMLATFAPGEVVASADEKDTGNILDELKSAIESVASIPEQVNVEVDRRVDEAKQEVSEAMFSMALTACGLPLLVALVGVAAFLVMRMRVRR